MHCSFDEKMITEKILQKLKLENFQVYFFCINNRAVIDFGAAGVNLVGRHIFHQVSVFTLPHKCCCSLEGPKCFLGLVKLVVWTHGELRFWIVLQNASSIVFVHLLQGGILYLSGLLLVFFKRTVEVLYLARFFLFNFG